MKVHRAKRVQRLLAFYRNNYDVQPPYHLLIDGTFCAAALANQINIREQLIKYVGKEVRLLTTKCVLAEMQRLGREVHGPYTIAKQFGMEPCDHDSERTTAAACILSLVRSKRQHYFVCTTDRAMTEQLRKRYAATPILYINYKTVTLDNASMKAELKAQRIQQEKTQVGASEQEKIEALKESVLGEEYIQQKIAAQQSKKRRRIKQPNPLSCKKKQKRLKQTAAIKKLKHKRKRKKKKKVAES